MSIKCFKKTPIDKKKKKKKKNPQLLPQKKDTPKK